MEHIEFLGKIVERITISPDKDRITFICRYGAQYTMYHEQDCCESVRIEDICGDLDDLVGSPILKAEERSSTDIFEGKPDCPDSFTWTFYSFATIKGYVDIRWLGESNGYYSESVTFTQESEEDYELRREFDVYTVVVEDYVNGDES